MVNEEVIRTFREVCDAINDLSEKRDHLIKRQQWGEITFEVAQEDIDTVFWIVREIGKLPIEIIPENYLSNGTNSLSNIKRILDQIDDFTLSGDPTSSRNSLSDRLGEELQEVMSHIGIWIPILALRAGEIQNWSARMQNVSADVTATLQQTKSQAEKGLDDIRTAVEAARAAAGEAGAAEFTHEFREEAKSIEKRGWLWLWPTGIFSTLAFILALSLMFGWFGEMPENTWEAIYRFGGRIVAISVLFYAAIWSGRIVLANMHLASVNKHRAVSLQTLQAFHQAVEDPAARDAVVLEAARAVYENVPSGYISRQAAEQSGHGRTLEIIKNAGRGARQDGD